MLDDGVVEDGVVGEDVDDAEDEDVVVLVEMDDAWDVSSAPPPHAVRKRSVPESARARRMRVMR